MNNLINVPLVDDRFKEMNDMILPLDPNTVVPEFVTRPISYFIIDGSNNLGFKLLNRIQRSIVSFGTSLISCGEYR